MTDMPDPNEVPRTYDLSLLERSRQKWECSPALRLLYGDLYREVSNWCRPGETLEIGSGIGVAKELLPDVVTSDVVKTPYVDCEMSAYAIRARKSGPWANVFALDVFHHLTQPLRFLESAAAALQPAGRIILVEPAATQLGLKFYGRFHSEPMTLEAVRAPFEFEANDGNGEFANMAMGEGLFRVHRAAVEARLSDSGLFIEHVYYRDLLAYPLTGGYSNPQFLPSWMVGGILRLEKLLPRTWFQRIGLRMVVVLRKQGECTGSV